MKRQQRRHVDFQRRANGLNEGFGFHGKLSDFVDDQDFAVVLGMVDGGKCDSIQFLNVDAIAQYAQSRIDVLVGDDSFFT